MRQRVKFERPRTKLAIDGRCLGFSLNKTDEQAVINVSGVIGDEWSGFTAIDMVPEIQAIDTPIVMRLNTPGGFVHDALDVYEALVEHPHHVRADIVAEAWSAGTILTAAADEIRIGKAAKYGVHRAWSGFALMGNSEELRGQIAQLEAAAVTLDKLDAQIAELIAGRNNQVDVSDVYEWMVGEPGVDGTEFVGQEAVDAGLADSLITKDSNTVFSLSPHKFKASLRRRAIKIQQMRAAHRN